MKEIHTPGVNDNNRYYTGQRKVTNDSPLYNYNARYYNPNLGIFIQPDSVEGPNRYAYVGGNPIMKNDPSGNCIKCVSYRSDINANPILLENPQPITNTEDLTQEQWEHLRRSAGMLYGNEWLGSASIINLGGYEAVLATSHQTESKAQFYRFGHPKNKFTAITPIIIGKKFDMAIFMKTNQHANFNMDSLDISRDIPQKGDPLFLYTYQDDTKDLRGKDEIHPVRARMIGYDKKGNYLMAAGSYFYSQERVNRSFYGGSGSSVVDKSGKVVGVYAEYTWNTGLYENNVFEYSSKQLSYDPLMIKNLLIGNGFYPARGVNEVAAIAPIVRLGQ